MSGGYARSDRTPGCQMYSSSVTLSTEKMYRLVSSSARRGRPTCRCRRDWLPAWGYKASTAVAHRFPWQSGSYVDAQQRPPNGKEGLGDVVWKKASQQEHLLELLLQEE